MIVLDANAAIEIVLESEVGRAFQSFILEGEEVIAPDLFHVEVSNAFWVMEKQKQITREKSVELLIRAQSLIDAFTSVSELLPEVLETAITLNHPAYDIAYLVLARRNAATLMTYDKKLISLCVQAGVDCTHIVNFPS